MKFTHKEPELRRRLCGGWLAVSCDDANIQIGVEGATEEEARRRFADAVRAWEALEPNKHLPRGLTARRL